MLKAGGNAIDAACVAALALGVVHPDASGIGGGGFAMIYIARTKQLRALDFRERAPVAASPALYFKDGKVDPALSKRGGLAVGVPGEVRGLEEMVRRWGALPFRRCVEPAQRLATKGFPVSTRLAKNLASIDPKTERDPAFVASIARAPQTAGAVWKRPELARTLAKLRSGGADAFYEGDIARQIVASVRAAGGVLSADDLARYTATDRTPLETRYRGLRVVSMPPPSSGGIVLVEVLGVLSARYPTEADLAREGRGSAAYAHVFIEALKHAFADRARYLGDTDFAPVDLARLTSPAYHAELARRIRPGAVLPRDAYGTLGATARAPRDGGTAHLSVIDAEGNAVALTTTVNLGFGAHLMAGNTGIVLNNQMDDFSLEPGVPNAFGLIGNEQNAIAPRKRPLSSMSPTIALDADGRARVVVGAAGGPTIISSTLQTLLGVVDGKLDAQAAVAAPRVHHQWFPDVLLVEPGIPVPLRGALEKAGHKLKELPHIGTANVIVGGPAGLEAGAEPRSPSVPAGY